jgi:hypothetical protein
MDNFSATEQAYKNGYEKGRQDASKWIPVSERLPEAQQRVLTITDLGYIRTDCIRKRDGHWFNEMFDPSTVTHWMPLPPAPKGE